MKHEREKGMPKYCYRRKESPFIWYKFTVDGETYCKSTETDDKKTAGLVVAKVRGDAVGGKVKKRLSDILLADLATKYIALCRTQPAISTKEDGINNVITAPKFKDRKAAEITREDILWYQAWRLDKAKASTVNRELGNFRNMFNVAVRDMGLNLDNPVAKIKFYSEKKFERQRFMLSEEKDKFFADPRTPWTTKDIVLFEIKEGLRQGELRDLLVTDINFQSGLIRVIAGNEDKTRFVPIFPDVEPLLRRWVEDAARVGSKWLFHNEDGSKLSRHGWLITSFEWACKRVGIVDLRFHDLRHTFASDFIMRGGDFKTLSLYMGHSVEAMTSRYAHLTPKYKAAQILLLPKETPYKVVELRYVGATGQT